jgi:hypothetical protein
VLERIIGHIVIHSSAPSLSFRAAAFGNPSINSANAAAIDEKGEEYKRAKMNIERH